MDSENLSAGQLLKQANQLKWAGRLDEAIALYHQVIEINPNFAWAYHNLGDVFVKQGKLDEAVVEYQKAIKVNPNSAWFYYQLGEALALQGDLEVAIKYLQKALEIKPNFYNFYQRLAELLIKDRNKEKIFCISFQRTGTTSVGQFFRDFGYRTVGWPEDRKYQFSKAWYEGNYEYIFSHKVFLSGQVFEDSPWFFPDFYKVLFHRCRISKFILITRDPEAWFRSMLSHNIIPTLVSTKRHCKVYRRELELYELIDKRLLEVQKLKLQDNPEHYKQVYKLHAREVIDFFDTFAPEALFHCKLEDPDKWKKLGSFFGIDVPFNYDVHVNKTKTTSYISQAMS